ncbi:TPA: hypothetical protein UMB92_000278 [Stenotrophomonas maltophilia]|uniref:hypothetical protein n=1 Tax=Stenotrophomonas maltophilia TaxID=40324 RepID=UPI0015DDAC69|nr:hypothetical protein [Stenotrophomonas maltophilia]MBA0446888.1 hypothetical protein [Stenotrophomonas maltophilia]HEL2977468.1 hypothetical protein [Stenotrophomonas maltophilia]
MIFDDFVNGRSTVRFGASLESLMPGFQKPDVQMISEPDQRFAVFSQGIEYLFDMNQLCLVQYDIWRIHEMSFHGHPIDASTSVEAFEGYLSEAGLAFRQEHSDGQIILLTATGVKLYFDGQTRCFCTGMKSG